LHFLAWFVLDPEPRQDPASTFRGAISTIIGSKVSSQLRYCERDEVHFTKL